MESYSVFSSFEMDYIDSMQYMTIQQQSTQMLFLISYLNFWFPTRQIYENPIRCREQILWKAKENRLENGNFGIAGIWECNEVYDKPYISECKWKKSRVTISLIVLINFQRWHTPAHERPTKALDKAVIGTLSTLPETQVGPRKRKWAKTWRRYMDGDGCKSLKLQTMQAWIHTI